MTKIKHATNISILFKTQSSDRCKDSVRNSPPPYSATPAADLADLLYLIFAVYTLYFTWESLGIIIFCCAGVRMVQKVPQVCAFFFSVIKYSCRYYEGQRIMLQDIFVVFTLISWKDVDTFPEVICSLKIFRCEKRGLFTVVGFYTWKTENSSGFLLLHLTLSKFYFFLSMLP